MKDPLRLLILGAHPDDADYHAGGLAALYRRMGHVVKMVSLTNGDAGHHLLRGPELAARRRAEAAAAGRVIGAEYEVLDIPDGELMPTLANRRRVIGLIRAFRPDLVLTHHPNDYHPDHRYTSQLVQDAAYLLTVPAIVPEVPHLARDPVIAYLAGEALKTWQFQPTVAVCLDHVLDDVVDMLDCHRSQFYEWLPYNGGYAEQVPADDAGRRDWLAGRVGARLRGWAERCQDILRGRYAPDPRGPVQYAEAFEACQYGAPLDEAARRRLFL
jgi:LmbE family N-acetylglucosaminyl deacetylase